VPSLYANGWRQGTLLTAEVPAGGIVLDTSGRIVRQERIHDSWVVTTQDCDLNGWEATTGEPLVELRPVFELTTPADWGILSRRLLLSDGFYITSDEPPAYVSPAVITAIDPHGPVRAIAPERAVALKTWLGYRYDRPAVPDHLVPLAKEIATRARRRSGRVFATELHDVLIQFDDTSAPPRFLLFAVVRDGADREEARRWLTTVGAAVPFAVGVLAGVEAAYKADTPLDLVESSYPADVTQLSWPGPEPHGAV